MRFGLKQCASINVTLFAVVSSTTETCIAAFLGAACPHAVFAACLSSRTCLCIYPASCCTLSSLHAACMHPMVRRLLYGAGALWAYMRRPRCFGARLPSSRALPTALAGRVVRSVVSVRLFQLYLLNQLAFDFACVYAVTIHCSPGTESQGHKSGSRLKLGLEN